MLTFHMPILHVIIAAALFRVCPSSATCCASLPWVPDHFDDLNLLNKDLTSISKDVNLNLFNKDFAPISKDFFITSFNEQNMTDSDSNDDPLDFAIAFTTGRKKETNRTF